MTPEERAVIEAAQRVSCWADEAPSERFIEALAELDAALAVHDRTAEPYWWQGPKPPLDFGQQWHKAGPNDPANKLDRRGDPGRIGTELAYRVGCLLPLVLVLLIAWVAA